MITSLSGATKSSFQMTTFTSTLLAVHCSEREMPLVDFRKNFYPSKDFNKLLDLPINQRRAPLLMNFIPTYRSLLPDVPRKSKSKSPPSAITPQAESSRPDQGSTFDPTEQPSTSAPQLIPPSQRKCRCRTVIAAEMGRKKAVADDLLADISNTVTAQPLPSQSQPKPKPKRLKKAQPKATATQIDSEDTLSISKIAEVEKSTSATEKRPTEAAPSELTRSKRLRSESATTSSSLKSNAPWAPPIIIEDKLVRAGDSADDIEVGVSLSTALLIPKDLIRNAEMSEYENFALMLQHSVQAIQHGHSFTMQAFAIKKELANKTREAASLQKIINKAVTKINTLTNQAEVAKKAQDKAEEKTDVAKAIAKVLAAEKKEAKAKMVEAQKELQDALATKEAEIKLADEKAYAEGATDIKEDCKKQVRHACNKGYTLGWMAALKGLAVPEDSPLRENKHIVLPFPPTPSQSEDEAESEKEAEAEKNKEAFGTNSPTLNEQVLDLTQGKENEVSKEATPQKTTSDAPIIEKSIDQNLQEIDAELAAEKAAEKSSKMSFEPQTDADAE
ncbi:nucleolar protein dao-5-like [Camellia sinensis]|uniref:nucleolar protein dao-5-like n=1 Tax=Camellia sinensis TaxID=4442 RepID=UPI001036DC6C|nr:nucleolar protein dao-5-like [Camellia sinensis]